MDNPEPRKCSLCLNEKLEILKHIENNFLLNKKQYQNVEFCIEDRANTTTPLRNKDTFTPQFLTLK